MLNAKRDKNKTMPWSISKQTDALCLVCNYLQQYDIDTPMHTHVFYLDYHQTLLIKIVNTFDYLLLINWFSMLYDIRINSNEIKSNNNIWNWTLILFS